VTLASLLVEHPFADDEGLLHTIDRTVTKGDVVSAARAVASRLGDLRGRGVAVQLPNSPELVEAMFGIWLAGGVHIPVNPRDPDVAAVFEATRPSVHLTESGLRPVDGAMDYADDVAFVMWTSGTTGRPKPVLHTHAGYLEILDRVLGPLRGGKADTSKRPTPNLIPVSMALNAGLYNTLFGLRAGAALVLMDRFEPATFAELVKRFEIRSTVLPPPAMAMLTDDEAVTDLSPLRYVRSITAPLSPLQARRFAAKFPVYVLNGYGQAEIGEVIGWTAADAKDHPEKIGSIGRPHPGVDIRIAEDGRLLVRPPSTAVGLDGRLDADGYVDTGDIARIDDDGFVWIEGRAGDLINRGGNKVFPEAVEEVLRLSPAVDDVAVVGVPDDRLGEVPVAYVVGRPVEDAELDALCREHLVPYKVPVAFRWIDELPRNEVGKLLRGKLR
jgi:acyl-CoA synthetase (AMP-forming)/AMP-acid ligase II